MLIAVALCKYGEETVSYLLIHCELGWELWPLLLLMIGVD